MRVIWDNLVLRRVFVLVFSVAAILTSMASCSLPFLNFGSGGSETVLGVLKRDPGVRADGFGQVRNIKGVDCSASACLGDLAGIKLAQTSADTIFYLTQTKGLFRTDSGGREWERLYVIPLNINPKKQVNNNGQVSDQDKTQEEINIETAALIAQNDALVLSDFFVDAANPSRILIAGQNQDKIGKIWSSSDAGKTFGEIYTEVEAGVGVSLVLVDALNPNRIYATLQKGAVIRSLDAGFSWQKVKVFDEAPVQFEFLAVNGQQILSALLPQKGLFVSSNDGETWENIVFAKKPSSIGESQNRDIINPFLGAEKFGKIEKFIFLPNANSVNLENNGAQSQISQAINSSNKTAPTQLSNTVFAQNFLLIADRQVWLKDNSDLFEKLSLPLQGEQYNILDIAKDPKTGLDKILVSVDDKLFETQNKGKSWSVKDKINLPVKTGNIGQILIDKDNTEIIYLLLVPKSKQGLFG